MAATTMRAVWGAAIGNESLKLGVSADAGGAHVRLNRASDGFAFAYGPMVFRMAEEGRRTEARDLRGARVERHDGRLVLTGRLGALDIHIAWTAPAGATWIEERISVRNIARRTLRLTDLEIGLTRSVDGIEEDMAQAVPFLTRATDPPDRRHEFTLGSLARPGTGDPPPAPFEATFVPLGLVPGRHRLSEGWAWRHGDQYLGIYRFCQEHLQYSALSRAEGEPGRIRFGGAVMHFGEPSELRRLRPEARVELGVTRYQLVQGGYEEAAYAYRALLDSQGCRFPATYNPPVHWEQLYDMEGAWDDRPGRYTRAAVEAEARKGVDYACEALYLDPGWDTKFATFLWGEDWLGPQRELSALLKTKYGLGLALHCPLATWMSMKGWSMGPFASDAWPAAAQRKPLRGGQAPLHRVPAVLDGRRNLALLPGGRAIASSVWEQGGNPLHQVAHLNDGWYGNGASWIAAEMPCWAQVDLGSLHRIDEVRIGNDALEQYTDRVVTGLRILVSDGVGVLRPVLERQGERLLRTASFRFDPVEARVVRIEITAADQGMPRLDEIEVYEASRCGPSMAAAHERIAVRGKEPETAVAGALVCLGSSAYLDEAARRMEALCEAGAVFIMFDGNWWPGACWDRQHGHPVPYLPEDHIAANVELARRIHARYPHVLIEMHDMLAGGNPARPTPVYYKYGLPGSYDENWGLELMWNPMADLREGRGAALYYYNLACNVPIYLHIDLRKDNRHAVVLWWYASTCRHLGIGGTHTDPAVVAAQQAAMKTYHRLERFFKRGEFYGAGPEVHVHALSAENAAVVNVFNLSDAQKTTAGRVALSTLGLDARRAYKTSQPWAVVREGALVVTADLPAWGADVCEVTPAGP